MRKTLQPRIFYFRLVGLLHFLEIKDELKDGILDIHPSAADSAFSCSWVCCLFDMHNPDPVAIRFGPPFLVATEANGPDGSGPAWPQMVS